MPPFDLETTYLALDGAGAVRAYPGGEAFWRNIDTNPVAGGTLVTVMDGQGAWPHWEMHPNGDEVLVALEGSARLMFEHPDGRTEVHEVAAGATLIVPAGVWHRAVDQRGLKMLFITYGAGTTHRPVSG
jgi:oxalate decarboxylase/phosphoglucose isomerase-like protein (cupin superfamily)